MWNKLAYAISCRISVLWNFTIKLLHEKYWLFLLLEHLSCQRSWTKIKLSSTISYMPGTVSNSGQSPYKKNKCIKFQNMYKKNFYSRFSKWERHFLVSSTSVRRYFQQWHRRYRIGIARVTPVGKKMSHCGDTFQSHFYVTYGSVAIVTSGMRYRWRACLSK